APIEPYLMQNYKGVETGYGFPGINWMSPSRAFRAYQLNPLLYQKTEAQEVSNRNSHIDNNENIKEKVQRPTCRPTPGSSTAASAFSAECASKRPSTMASVASLTSSASGSGIPTAPSSA